ncbi:MAG: hypothetical protein O2971_05730 [Proteobacteria bacterium]|nr:hypothetical protein [Pseudomonadota bacterium]
MNQYRELFQNCSVPEPLPWKSLLAAFANEELIPLDGVSLNPDKLPSSHDIGKLMTPFER